MGIVHIKSGTNFKGQTKNEKSDKCIGKHFLINSVKRFYWMRKLKTQVEILILYIQTPSPASVSSGHAGLGGYSKSPI